MKIILMALAILLPALVFSGDFGEGGGRPRIATYVELKAVAGSVQKFIYFESLAMMGDVGEGGGGVRKWQQEFQTRYQRRLKTNGATTDIRQHEGERFTYVRRKMPMEEFSRFEIKSIVGFRTTTHGAIALQNVYNYHLKELINPFSTEPDRMSDLIYFETLEGIMVTVDEITEIIVEFRANP